ncbi:MAG: cell division protein FtsZ [Deltaproteobacteria bacterium]|nr:MAG: cell division protein FtsZ [Deltaproteobacteria bacterium]
MFEFEENQDLKANIKVIGLGGGGGNAINTMISDGLKGVDFVAANTDAQALKLNFASKKLQLGAMLTRGLGAGGNPEVGHNATLEDRDALHESLGGADMIFLTAGMGGGTGTGGAPIVAEVAKELGALTVGVVTRPFFFEGKRRIRQAEEGIAELRKVVDTLIVVPNQKLLTIAGKNTPILDTFKLADSILLQAVKGITDLINIPGLINLDFADVRTIMDGMGMAIMGTGVSNGENRAVDSAQKAISSPLLEDNSIQGAKGVLINITGSPNMTLFEASEAATLVQEEVHEDSNTIFGAVIDEAMGDDIRVTVIATGFGNGGTKMAANFKNHVIPMTTTPRSENRDLPTYLRRDRKLEEPDLTKISFDEFDDDDLEVPTFLRRQTN